MNKLQFLQWLKHHCADSSMVSPLVMGILNCTPDSFSDGGQFLDAEKALQQVRQMIEDGVDIIDIGGESSRPGSTPISENEELERVIPIIKKIRNETDICLSLDTTKPLVMQEGINNGIDIINDINALNDEKALRLVSSQKIPVCLMHNAGSFTKPSSEDEPNVIKSVTDFFRQKLTKCMASGIDPENIIIDPGFGFGKTVKDNLCLINRLDQFLVLKQPVLIGFSRKSTLGSLINKPPNERIYAGVAMTVPAWQNGAKIFRTHDVLATKQALTISLAIAEA